MVDIDSGPLAKETCDESAAVELGDKKKINCWHGAAMVRQFAPMMARGGGRLVSGDSPRVSDREGRSE